VKLIRCLAAMCMVASMPVAQASPPELLIGSPDMPHSSVDAAGALQEDWGVVGLRLEEPSAAKLVGQRYQVAPVPTVETVTAAGPVTLTATAYRAPIWREGVDVLTARLANAADREVAVRLRVSLPEQAGIGERAVLVNRRLVMALPREPAPVRTERDWGCTGGVVPMPGWAKPQGECDPAFHNISAGMGGVSIIYRFSVPAGAKRTVVLGLCESHWAEPGRRPLMLYVEGAAGTAIDPIAAWGQHTPGCLRFDACDANEDGRVEVVVVPHPDAQDRNTILNVVWVFAPNVHVDTDDVLRGSMSQVAEHYVDVGGERDQLLYETGPLTYELKLAPRAEQEMTFLVACRVGSVPDLATSAWARQSLRRAAEDVWSGWAARGVRVELPAPHATRWEAALAQIAMTRAQNDAFFAALPARVGVDQFSHAGAAHIIAALDFAGCHAEAERMLRLYWDKPVPNAFASLAQGDDGRWQDAVNDSCAHGFALQALARHALLSGDRSWAKMAWPAIKAGSEWITRADAQALASADAKRASAIGLLGAGRVAELLGLAEAKHLETLARGIAPGAAWRWMEPGGEIGPVAQAAAELIRLRNGIVEERGEELWLLAGVHDIGPETVGLSVEKLPTELGPISVTVRRAPKALRLAIELAPYGRAPGALVLRAPALDGAKPVAVQVDGQDATLSAEGTLRLRAPAGAYRVAFVYR